MRILKDILLDEYHGDDSLLYHYTTMESACKILESNTLRLSNLINMNDPLEFCNYNGFGFNGTCDDIANIVQELELSLEERQNTVRLLCFCKDSFCCKSEWNDKKYMMVNDVVGKTKKEARDWSKTYTPILMAITSHDDIDTIREEIIEKTGIIIPSGDLRSAKDILGNQKNMKRKTELVDNESESGRGNLSDIYASDE